MIENGLTKSGTPHLSPAQLEQLEQEGFTLIKGFLDTETTARARAHMDSLLPPIADAEDAKAQRLHTLRHPIPGAILAELLTPELVALAEQTLQSSDLRLLEQVLIRTDPASREKRSEVVGATPADRATGWHVDMAFLPEHYQSTPRQTYYHMVHSLNNVPAGGGAFTVVPGSHHKTFAAASKLGEEGLPELKANPIEVAGVNVSEAIEVLPEEGDLIIFNPMALHSASTNVTDVPRYVYFASFHDPSAEYLIRFLNMTNYRPNFPDSLRDNLPQPLQKLLLN
jgi:ectoine hydroxylase-related dioxygenase (phytanoyl-CoA dioxygenase family)